MTLKEYLFRQDEKPFSWAGKYGIKKDTVYRACDGLPIRWQSAVAISKATGGVVTVEKLMEVAVK